METGMQFANNMEKRSGKSILPVNHCSRFIHLGRGTVSMFTLVRVRVVLVVTVSYEWLVQAALVSVKRLQYKFTNS